MPEATFRKKSAITTRILQSYSWNLRAKKFRDSEFGAKGGRRQGLGSSGQLGGEYAYCAAQQDYLHATRFLKVHTVRVKNA